jgi:hypothetical protein
MTVNISKKDLTYLVRNFKFDQVANENDPHVYEAKKQLYEKFKRFWVSFDNIEYDLKSNLFYITFPNLTAVNTLFDCNFKKKKFGKHFHHVFFLGKDKV